MSEQCSSVTSAPVQIYEEGTLENDCPTLKPLEHPTTAVAFVMQAMNHTAMDMPLSLMQKPRVWLPSATCSVGFKHVYDGFMCAKRVCFPQSAQEALQMIVAENAELTCTSPKDGFKPRRVALSILIPEESTRSSRAYEALDAFASLSQLHDSEDCVTNSTRFSMFVGLNSVAMQQTVFAEAMTERNCHSETLVMRWRCVGPNGPYVRTEVCKLSCPKMDAMSIQSALVCHAARHGVKLAPVFFKHPPDFSLKDVLEKSSAEFRSMVYDVAKFDKRLLKEARQCDLLEVVDIYLRISSRRGDSAEDTEAVMDDSAMHALLLCRDGASGHAKDFVRTFKKGLPPAKGFFENDQQYFEHIEWMSLHALVIGVERVCMDSVVSLYGCSGIPGERIESSGSFVWRNFITMKPIHSVQETYHVLPCTSLSLIPANKSLAPFVKHGLDEAIKLYNKTFISPDSTRSVPEVNHIHFPEPGKEDLFLMAALKINLSSSRCTVGETLAFLVSENAPTSLVQMIVNSANKLGLHSPLSDVFTRCSEAIKHNDSELNVARDEVARLKRICDAALLIGCSKRAREEAGLTNKKKVSQVLNVFGLSPLKGHFCADQAPRDAHSSHTLVSLVISMCKRKSASTSANSAEVRVVLEQMQGAMDSIARAIHVCCADNQQECFLFVHGDDRDGVECHAVEAGELVACTVGRVFEAEKPCIASVKRKQNGCLFTPLVREPPR